MWNDTVLVHEEGVCLFVRVCAHMWLFICERCVCVCETGKEEDNVHQLANSRRGQIWRVDWMWSQRGSSGVYNLSPVAHSGNIVGADRS